MIHFDAFLNFRDKLNKRYDEEQLQEELQMLEGCV